MRVQPVRVTCGEKEAFRAVCFWKLARFRLELLRRRRRPQSEFFTRATRKWRSGAIELPGVIDISGLGELRAITADKKWVEIGALATHAAIGVHEAVRHHLPALAEACRTIGAVQIQNQGTIGGNIMNAAACADTECAHLRVKQSSISIYVRVAR